VIASYINDLIALALGHKVYHVLEEIAVMLFPAAALSQLPPIDDVAVKD
jgi:hypothetical protein